MVVRSIHIHISPIPRVSGEGASRKFNSVARAVDYICREGPYTEDKLAKRRHKTEKEERLIASGFSNIPAWGISKTGSPRKFYALADKFERADGRLGYRWTCDVPRDVDAAGRSEELINLYMELFLGDHPLVWAMHRNTASDGGPNPHFHIIACERCQAVGRASRAGTFFLRFNPRYPERGGCAKDRSWHERGFFKRARKGWATCCNQILEEIGSDVCVTEKSYEDRGIQKLPGIHYGPTVRARAARGDHLTPSPSFLRRAKQEEKLKPIEDELSELKLKQENDMKIETANRENAQAALRNSEAAAAEQEQESINQQIRMRIGLDRERQRVLGDDEADDIRRDVAKALAGWKIKWKRTHEGAMPAFVARSGPHRIDFDGHEITGHDSSEETLSRMVQVAKAAGKKRVEISGSPTAKRRLAELCQAAGIEVVEPLAKETKKGKAAEPKPVSAAKPAGTPNVPAQKSFDIGPTPTPFDVMTGPTPPEF